MLSGFLLVGIALLTLGWVMLHLLRQNGRLLMRIETLEQHLGIELPQSAAHIEGLPVGTIAPEFRLLGVFGETLTLHALRGSGKPIILIFSDPGCSPCNSLLPDIARWQHELSEKFGIASISRGAVEVNRAKSTEHGLKYVLLQQENEVGAAYKVDRTPTAVLVNADGTIGSPLAAGPEAIRGLVRNLTDNAPLVRRLTTHRPQIRLEAPSERRVQPEIAVGTPAPVVTLPALDGELVDLAAFRGSRTLLLFWNPNCGFCQRMLADLRAWNAKKPLDAPHLVLVSAGSAEQHHALDLDIPVLLDEGFQVGRLFGAGGTPGAVLLDDTGIVRSPVAIGAPAIMSLLNTSTRFAPQHG